MNNQKLEELVTTKVWKLIKEHYNVDENEPNMLIAKKHLGKNQINQIGSDLAIFFQTLLASIFSQEEDQEKEKTSPEEPIDNIPIVDDHDDEDLYTSQYEYYDNEEDGTEMYYNPYDTDFYD